MIHAVSSTAFIQSQRIGETRSQEELEAIIIAQNKKEKTAMTARKTPAKTTTPAGVKKPADRQTAKDDVASEVRIFNWRGTDYEVDTDRIDDLEFIEKLESNMFAGALTLMLGEKQYVAFKAQVKEAEGRVSMQTTKTFLEEYMEFASRGN